MVTNDLPDNPSDDEDMPMYSFPCRKTLRRAKAKTAYIDWKNAIDGEVVKYDGRKYIKGDPKDRERLLRRLYGKCKDSQNQVKKTSILRAEKKAGVEPTYVEEYNIESIETIIGYCNWEELENGDWMCVGGNSIKAI